MWFLYEMNSMSRWKDELDVVPETISVPVCLPRKELAGLPGQMLSRVEDDYAEIEGRFEKFQYIMDVSCSMKLSHVNWRDFRLAAALIRSRWVMVDDVGFVSDAPKWLKTGTPDDQAGLAPYFDMLNHGIQYNCSFGFAYGVGLEVKAMTDIKAGDEVLIQYGTRSDDELLLNYGFVLGPGKTSV